MPATNSGRLVGRSTRSQFLILVVTGLGTIFYFAKFFSLKISNDRAVFPAGSGFFSHKDYIEPCAINLYGLPRKFKDLVLPGLLVNVIQANARYQCDYFVHYYDKRKEDNYRGVDRGRSGTLDPDEVKLLTDAVRKANALYLSHQLHHSGGGRHPRVVYSMDTDESFNAKRGLLLHKIHSITDENGDRVYMPLSEKEPFSNTTIANIIKAWHSQDAAWNLMETEASAGDLKWGHYSRVAMLRIDLLYITPIDIYKLPNGAIDTQNEFAVIPNFGNFPVNDRMIYGPSDAVRIYAADRFRRLSEHVHRVAPLRHGIHPERYLFHTIFPAIRDAGVAILRSDANLCFLRVRADLSVRIQDCGKGCVHEHNKRAIEDLLQRSCSLNLTNTDVTILECSDRVRRNEFPMAGETCLWQGCPWQL